MSDFLPSDEAIFSELYHLLSGPETGSSLNGHPAWAVEQDLRDRLIELFERMHAEDGESPAHDDSIECSHFHHEGAAYVSYDGSDGEGPPDSSEWVLFSEPHFHDSEGNAFGEMPLDSDTPVAFHTPHFHDCDGEHPQELGDGPADSIEILLDECATTPGAPAIEGVPRRMIRRITRGHATLIHLTTWCDDIVITDEIMESFGGATIYGPGDS